MALPNQERTIVCNMNNWKIILEVDYDEERPIPITLESP